MTIMVNLNDLHYCKEKKTLGACSELFAGAFPRDIIVKSHVTGNEVKFSPVGPGHRLFNDDFWDGEMCIYVADVQTPRVDYLYVYHAY